MATQYIQHPPHDERPLGELLSDLGGEVKHLFRTEVELAKAEMRHEATKAGRAGAMFGGAAVAGFLGLLLVGFAAAWGLAEAIPAGLAFLAVGLLFLAVAGLLAVQGRHRMADVNPIPTQTMQTLGQDVSAAKDSLSRGVATHSSPQQARWR